MTTDCIGILDQDGERRVSRRLFKERNDTGRWPDDRWQDADGVWRLSAELNPATPQPPAAPTAADDEMRRARNAAFEAQHQRRGPIIADGAGNDYGW